MSTPDGTAGLRVAALGPADADDTTAMTTIADLVNRAFAAVESDLWVTTSGRTDPAELAGLTRAGELAVAVRDGRIVGCVRVQQIDGSTGGFAMLATDAAHRRTGVGRALVDHAEHTCRAAGRDAVQLKILGPSRGPHPHTEFLAGWYGRLGYRFAGRSELDLGPGGERLLARPCEFRHYRRTLPG